MKKLIAGFAAGFVAALATAALAVVGNPPQPNGQEAAINQTWLLGLAGGQNFSYKSGLTATASGTQSTCLNLTYGNFLKQVATVANDHDSVCLPFAIAGESLMIANAGGHTLDIFALAANNPLTGAGDTINASSNSTAYSPTTNTNAICFAPKNGIWNCIKGS